MQAFTGAKRISAAFKKTFTDANPQIDRIPAYLFTGQCNTQLIGASIRNFLLDPQIFVKAQLAAYERYKPDILLMMWDLLTDVEAIGNELKFPENSLCISTKYALEDKGKLSSLELPDPTKDGRLPAYLEAVAETKKIISDAIVSAVIAGPWTIAIGLRGATELIRDAIKDPDYVHELMQFCTQQSISFAEAIIPLGVGLGYSEAPASCSLISPKMYRAFVLPYHKQIVDHFKAKKVGVGLHICGYADPILEDMVNTGATNISIDAPTNLAKAVAATRGKAVLIGNLNTNLFFSGSREQMKQAMINCMDSAPQDSGYILASGCEVPGIAPLEKIDWFRELVDELGQYN
ncbi:MAG: uroporphyrinogen decarboxylase family protein [Desulfobacterales bacterium]|jgi:uroporphyrinogen decarboxylase